MPTTSAAKANALCLKSYGIDSIFVWGNYDVVALEYVPDGSFHNALVDAQALLCIYSHSLRPDEGCEKVYELLNERMELKKAA